MAAASPFPNVASTLQPLAQAIYIAERFTHIPAFYVRTPHLDAMNTQVTQNGNPLLGLDKKPFVVAQVAEERRWAIQADGEVLPQVEFAAMLEKVRMEYYAVLRTQGHPNAGYPEHNDPARDYIPAVARYVSWRVDPEDNTKLIQIGYDKHATAGAKPEAFVDNQGERLAESRMETLTRAYHDSNLRARLTAREKEEVEAHLDLKGGGTDEIASKLQILTELRNSGDLDDEAYIAKVAALTGAPAPKRLAPSKPPKKVKAERPEVPAMCGKVCKGDFGRRAHERQCEKCLALSAPPEAPLE